MSARRSEPSPRPGAPRATGLRCETCGDAGSLVIGEDRVPCPYCPPRDDSARPEAGRVCMPVGAEHHWGHPNDDGVSACILCGATRFAAEAVRAPDPEGDFGCC